MAGKLRSGDSTTLRVGQKAGIEGTCIYIAYAGMPNNERFSLAIRETGLYGAKQSFNLFYPIDTKEIVLEDVPTGYHNPGEARLTVTHVDPTNLTIRNSA